MNDFNERLEHAAKAKLAMKTRALANTPNNSPGHAERQAERIAVSIAREGRQAEAEEQKRAKAARVAEEKATAAVLPADAEKDARGAEANRAANDALALKAAQKAGRDVK